MIIEVDYDTKKELTFQSFGVDQDRLKGWDDMARGAQNVDDLVLGTLEYAQTNGELCYFMMCCGEMNFVRRGNITIAG